MFHVGNPEPSTPLTVLTKHPSQLAGVWLVYYQCCFMFSAAALKIGIKTIACSHLMVRVISSLIAQFITFEDILRGPLLFSSSLDRLLSRSVAQSSSWLSYIKWSGKDCWESDIQVKTWTKERRILNRGKKCEGPEAEEPYCAYLGHRKGVSMAGVSGVNHLGESNGGYKYFEDSAKWIRCVIS